MYRRYFARICGSFCCVRRSPVTWTADIVFRMLTLCCPRCATRGRFWSNPCSRLLLLCAVAAVVWTLYHFRTTDWDLLRAGSQGQSHPQRRVDLDFLQNPHKLLVDTPGCSIPDVDPYDESLDEIVSPAAAAAAAGATTLACDAKPPLTYTDGRALRINRTALELHYDDQIDRCQFERITRPPHVKSDNEFEYSPPQDFTKDVEDTKAEFVRVACFGTKGTLIYANFHTAVFTKKRVEKRCNASFQKFKHHQNNKDIFDFLILGVDSVSRLNFVRHMSKTRNFLQDKLNAVELKGYNKVADNTFVNLSPMFAGKFVEELPWSDETHEMHFDNYSFVWKDASSLGYRTLFAEDAPNIAIFNYDKPGFLHPPSDYYLRPFSLAVEDHGSIWNSNHNCIGSKPETKVVLDYVGDFMKRFYGKPRFAFSFITRLTHDGINKAAMADDLYYNFFQNMHDRGLLKNTVVLFYSDHGMRFGKIRETFIGQLEERLPFLLLSLPVNFASKYPKYRDALRRNAHKLTTPFDIYETLNSLMHFKGKVPRNHAKSRGMNLLADVPPERTCKSAAIHSHWCTCHRQEQVDPASDVAQAAAVTVVDHINDLLSAHHGVACATLALDEVTDARVIVPSGKMSGVRGRGLHEVLRNADVTSSEREAGTNEYIVTFRTNPGGAMFEANVRKSDEDRTLKLVGEISRINAYGDQSVCIQYYQHKMFCYCN